MPSSASIRMPSASGVGNGFFLQAVTTSTARPHPASASPPRIGNPARHERCRQEGRSRQTRQAAMTDGLPSSVDVLPLNRKLEDRRSLARLLLSNAAVFTDLFSVPHKPRSRNFPADLATFPLTEALAAQQSHPRE